MSREKSITIFFLGKISFGTQLAAEIIYQNRDTAIIINPDCSTQQPKKGHTHRRNIYRPNSNQLSSEHCTEHLTPEDTLQKVCQIPGVSSKDSINRLEHSWTKIVYSIYVKASPIVSSTEITPLRIFKIKKTSQSATVRYALLAANASKVVVSVI